MIVIIDYGMGNIGSIRNMLALIGAEVSVSGDPAGIEKADKLILPGVGAFDSGIKNLEQKGLREILDRKVLEEKTPILGICLGMQLMGKGSEEGVLHGLDWIEARSSRFRFDQPSAGLKIPHMGWNSIRAEREHWLLKGLEQHSRFYFVHSFHMDCSRHEDVLATTEHGVRFVSAVAHDNITGVQFHPEKSHRFGMQLLKNFAEYR